MVQLVFLALVVCGPLEQAFHCELYIVSLLAKEDEGLCRELCKQVVDEWMQRETERMTKAEEGKDKAKELAGEQ